MSKTFQIKPRRIKRSNGQTLTPEMTVTVCTAIHVSNPFNNGAREVREAYARQYNFDYAKACCTPADFDYRALD